MRNEIRRFARGAYTLRMLRAYALRVWPRNTERMVDHGLQLEFT